MPDKLFSRTNGSGGVPVNVGSVVPIASDDILYADPKTGFEWLRSGYVEDDPAVYPDARFVEYGSAEYESYTAALVSSDYFGICADDAGNYYAYLKTNGYIYKITGGFNGTWTAWVNTNITNDEADLAFDGTNILIQFEGNGTMYSFNKDTGLTAGTVSPGFFYGLAVSDDYYFSMSTASRLSKVSRIDGAVTYVDTNYTSVSAHQIDRQVFLTYTANNGKLLLSNGYRGENQIWEIDVDTGEITAYLIDTASFIANRGLLLSNGQVYSMHNYTSGQLRLARYQQRPSGYGLPEEDIDAGSGNTLYMRVK